MKGLSGKERLWRVLHGQPVDRIPVSPFIHVNYVKEFFGTHDVDWAVQTPEVYRHFGFDLMHRNCTPAHDALGPPGPGWEIEVARRSDGRDETTLTTIHTPDGDLRCVEALRWTYEYDAESSVIEYPIKSEADLDLFERYQPPAAPTDTAIVARAKRAVGDEGLVAPWIQGAFNLVAFYYRRLDDLMLEHFQARYRRFVDDLIAAGADVLSYAGNIANGKLVGPRFFRQHVAPFECEAIAHIQGRGVPVLYHNCGYARSLLPIYPSLGMRAYESLTPPPYGDTQLEEALDVFGTGTALVGNIDQLDLLRKGTPGEIEAAVRRVLDTVRGRAHFILATTDYFNENTPHGNIHALAEAGLRYGAL